MKTPSFLFYHNLNSHIYHQISFASGTGTVERIINRTGYVLNKDINASRKLL